VDFACRIPAAYKLSNFAEASCARVSEDDLRKYFLPETPLGTGKAVLRKAMQRLMPPEVTTRVKQGFIPPAASWFRGESIDYINKLLRDRNARIYQFLQPSYVQQILDEHSSNKRNHRLLIWSFLSFEWWCRNYLEEPASV
jgi:asparagine synthase (glutamine-hydrolysing)